MGKGDLRRNLIITPVVCKGGMWVGMVKSGRAMARAKFRLSLKGDRPGEQTFIAECVSAGGRQAHLQPHAAWRAPQTRCQEGLRDA